MLISALTSHKRTQVRNVKLQDFSAPPGNTHLFLKVFMHIIEHKRVKLMIFLDHNEQWSSHSSQVEELSQGHTASQKLTPEGGHDRC